jgi:hypothetical protein
VVGTLSDDLDCSNLSELFKEVRPFHRR